MHPPPRDTPALRGQPRPPSNAAAAALAIAAVGASLGATERALAATGTLLTYCHVAVKQRALQSLLSSGLPGVTTTTVGRIADFERALQDGPDAVLTLPLVLGDRGLTASLRGSFRGSNDEHYALVASSALDRNRVTSVGALDILGREGTTRFVRTLVGGEPRIERVTKVEDLLPLLQMQRVESVLLPARLVQELRAASRLPLVDVELEHDVGLPAAAGVGPNAAAVLGVISRMPKELSKLFGVDAWR